MKYRATSLITIAAALSAIGGPSIAADTAKGAQIAHRWCANCHLVGEAPHESMQQGPPSFREIAGRLTDAQLRTFLTHPHGAMPDLSLSRAEIEDVIAHIRSLH